jgi:MinD superfamily P-loop ATPase
MKQIAIISGKGGTGKSSIAAAFSTLSEKVVVADCDVDAANLYLLFNPSHEEEEVYIGGYKAVIAEDLCKSCLLCMNYCRFDAILATGGKPTIIETSCDGCFLCSRVCPSHAITMKKNDRSRMYSGSFRNGKMVYGRLAPGEENSGKLVNMVREKAIKVSERYNLETIVLDGPPGTGCPVISTITGVDIVVIVTEPTISGLHDLQKVYEVVKMHKTGTSVIVNKYDLNPEVSGLIEAWCLKTGLDIAGYIPFDEHIVEAMTRGLTITEMDRNSETSRIIYRIWNNLHAKETLYNNLS